MPSRIRLLDEYPDSVKVQALRAKIQKHYTSSLYATAKDLLGYRDITRFTHGEMIDSLEAPTLRKLIVMPRGTFKSSIACVAYPIQLLIQNPNLRILIDSEKYENSKNFIREIKGKLEDPYLTQIFGEFKTDHNWAEGSITISKRTKVLKEASITASGIGAGKTGQHYDVLICDDYNSPQNSEKPEQREKIINHWRMNTSILDPGGIMVLIGTRYAINDVIGHILANEVIS